MATMITRTIKTTTFTTIHYDKNSDTIFHGLCRAFGEYDEATLNAIVRKEYAKGGDTIAAKDPYFTSALVGMDISDFLKYAERIEPGKGTQGMITRTISATRYTAVIYDAISGALVEKEMTDSCKRDTDELMSIHRKEIAKGGPMVVAVKNLETISDLYGMSVENFIALGHEVDKGVEDEETVEG